MGAFSIADRASRPLRLAGLALSICAGLLLGSGAAVVTVAAAQPATGVDQVLEPSIQTPTVGQPVAFNIATNSSAGPITGTTTWSFDDGTTQTTAGGVAEHAFSSPGQYNVTVTGTTATGQTVSATTTVRVVGGAPASSVTSPAAVNSTSPTTAAPIAVALPQTTFMPTSVSIVNPPATADVDQPLTFTAANAVSPNPCGIIAGYRWDFGDATPELSGQTVGHTYTAPGSYNVNLTVTDCSGSTATTSTQVRVAAAPPGVTVSFAGGWNLVAGTAGAPLIGAANPLYTLQAGDSTYEAVSATTPLTAGEGYWAYFPVASTGTIPVGSAGPMTVPLAAGAYVMIGNSGSTPATVSGADSVLVYSQSSGYQPVTELQPGQGALAYSAAGGTATITPAS